VTWPHASPQAVTRPHARRQHTRREHTRRHSTRRPGRPGRHEAAGPHPMAVSSVLLAAGLATIVAGAGGLALSRSPGAADRPAAASVPAPAGTAAGVPWPSAAGPVALPAELTVPAIGVRTRLIHLGLTADRALQVPASVRVAGWYDRGPRPGAPGPAVIAGHVDSVAGPGIFYRLADLHRGDRAYVRRTDGTLVVFRVTAVRTYPKDRLPAAAVYGPAPGPQLRLITCGGPFDPARRSYLSNVVVYAVMAGAAPASARAAPR
jgi:sortase (surface protein transpeptidase)